MGARLVWMQNRWGTVRVCVRQESERGGGFLRGIGRDGRWALWRALRAAGVFRLERAASKQAQRAATYRVRLDFGALSGPHIAFEFRSLSEARDLFALRKDGNIYSRAANPTVLVLEKRVAELEGGIGAAAVASGQAAVAVALLALAKKGEHIVAARQL